MGSLSGNELKIPSMKIRRGVEHLSDLVGRVEGGFFHARIRFGSSE